jgi:predicted transcriptional regulator of viral defense system
MVHAFRIILIRFAPDHMKEVTGSIARREVRISYLFDTLCAMPGRVYNALLDQAQQQYGFLTPEDARVVGVDPTQLRLMAARHTLERRSHGLYRMTTVPPTELDAYMEATLWTGRRGALSHETGLDLYELCDVNPTAIHLTVPSNFRTRKVVPEAYRLHREDLDESELRWHEGIPIVSPARAIRGAIEDALGSHLVRQAIDNARARGLISKGQAEELRAMHPREAAALG